MGGSPITFATSEISLPYETVNPPKPGKESLSTSVFCLSYDACYRRRCLYFDLIKLYAQ
jgi:hypothetical protein